MTETQIQQQIEAIRSVTKEALKSKEAAAAFLKAAGIAPTPKKTAISRSAQK